MNESLITVRYVKALFGLAVENKLLDIIEKDVESLLGIMAESTEFNAFIENPILKRSSKLKMFDQLFAGKLNKLTIQFLYLLVNNNREILLKEMCHYFKAHYRQNRKIKEAVITTAIPLSKTHRDEIYKYISKKFKVSIDMSEKVEPEIIGGFVLRIEDQQINASLQSQLNKIKRELINT
jgi:F-type H+-transporting ATPase subunit delta